MKIVSEGGCRRFEANERAQLLEFLNTLIDGETVRIWVDLRNAFDGKQNIQYWEVDYKQNK